MRNWDSPCLRRHLAFAIALQFLVVPARASSSNIVELTSRFSTDYEQRLAEGDRNGARAALEIGIAACSDCDLLHEKLAYLYWSDVHDDKDHAAILAAQVESLSAVEAALARHEVSRNSLWLLGQASVGLGDRHTLARIYSEVLAKHENSQTYVDYAEALAKLGDSSAETMLRRALALNPEIGMEPLGEWLLDHNREREVLALIPSGALGHYAHFVLGVALERLGEAEKARVEYRKYQDAVGIRIPFSEAFPAPARFRIPGSQAQANAEIRFDDKAPIKAASVGTALTGFAFLISGEAGNENRGVKRGVGWEVRNSVLRGAVQRQNTTLNCPGATNSGSTTPDQYISAMCYPNRFQGLCSAWCNNGSPCATTPSQESKDVAMAVYYGNEPDPVGQLCPGGYAIGSDNCDPATRCNGNDLQSYSLSGALFNFGTTGTCPTTNLSQQCMRSDTLVSKTCGGNTCFYNNYYVALAQYNGDGTALPVGGVTLSEVKLHGYVPFQSTGELRRETELRRLDEYGGSFQGTPTQVGGLAARTIEEISVFGLIDGTYHWRARLADGNANENVGPWVSFGNNIDSATDFQVSTSCGPSGTTLTGACGGAALSVGLAGTGTGRIVSNPAGIDCPGTCATMFSLGTQVLLSPLAAPGSVFAGWSGDPVCSSGSLTMSANHACTATFTASAPAYTLTVSKAGSGTVSSSDGGINCGAVCSHTYVGGTTVTLVASAASGWSFSSWSGSCSGGPVVQLGMTGTKNCTATFIQNTQPTPVTTTGAATSVTASSATLNGTINPENLAATAFFEYGPDPFLGNATPGVPFGAGNNSFFSYAQPVTGLACATTYRFRAVGVSSGGDYRASNNTFTTANCPPAPCYALNLIANGDAPAPVPSPANASGCPNGQYHDGDHIALTAASVAGDVVTGWGGTDNDASTASTNTVTMSQPYNRAVYVIEQHICYHLSLGYTGQGSAPVATNPVVSCPQDYFPWGYEVDGSGAAPATGWQIGGWSGTEYDYSQLDHNFILMPQNSTTALVEYTPIPYLLTVSKIGNGSGTITSDIPGIDCGATCSASYPYGTTVTLTATPDPGSTFLGWSGSACNGGVPTMTSPTGCTAVFGLAPPNLGTSLYTLAPCRVVDTRTSQSPILSGAASPRLFQITGACGIPATARAVAANITVVNATQAGYVTLFPADQGLPATSTLNFQAGQIRSNNAILPLSVDGKLAAILGPAAGGQVDVVLDVSGYFAADTPSLPTFASRVDLTTGAEPLGLGVADFDGDGKKDIAVTIYNNGAGNHLTIFRNTGTSGHLQFDSVDVPTGTGPEGLAVGDLDNDGKVDIVTMNPGNSSISVLRNLSTPGFIDFQSVSLSLSSPPTPHQVVIADFDSDGKPDLIVTSNNGRIVSVFHHASDPNTIAFDSRTDFPTEGYLNLLTTADLDRGGRPDILVPIGDTGHLTLFQNTSSPGNVQASTLPLLATGTSPKGIAAGDLNNDQLPDVVVTVNGGLGIFTNGSSPGVFNLPRTDVTMGTNPESAAIGDLDRDGLQDVVVADPNNNALILFHNTTASAGAAINLTPLQTSLSTGLTPINVVLGDVDGDGWLDLVVANHMAGTISIFLNTTGQP